MLRREDEGDRPAYTEPSGDIAKSRKRRRRLQESAYWGGLLLLAGLLAMFLAFTLPQRGKAEQAEREALATITAQKTESAGATSTAAAQGSGTGQ